MTVNGVLFRCLLAIIMLAPLPLGSNRPAAWSALVLAVGVLLVAWAAAAALGRATTPLPLRRFALVVTPYCLVLIWATIQTLPGILTLSHPLWNEVGVTAGPLSLDPAMTRTAIMRLAAYGGIFLLASQLGRERVRSREGLIALALTGVAYATYGLIAHLTGSERLLWMDKWAYEGDLTSTFVNRNSYASYAGMGMTCCLALFINGLRQTWKPQQTIRDKADLLLVSALPFLIGALIIGSALMLSHSRGGASSTVAAIITLMVALTMGKVVPIRKATFLTTILVVLVGAVIALSGELTFERFAQQGITDDTRTAIYTLTMNAIADSPWTGYGFGAFEPTFRLYRDGSLPQNFFIDMAHNTHLELAMELGIPATALLYFSFAAIATVLIRGLMQRRRDQVYPALGLSIMALLGLHGMVDFSAQMPAIAATFAFILGIAYAQSFNTIRHQS